MFFGLALALLVLAPVPVGASGTAGYRIGPKDLREIKIFEVPDLNIERRITKEGTINLPLIGDVPVQGLTDRASRKIQVQRRDRDSRPAQLDVDYKRIVAGKKPDFPLQSGAAVIAKESFL